MEIILNVVWKLRENIESNTESMEIIKISVEINGLQEKEEMVLKIGTNHSH